MRLRPIAVALMLVQLAWGGTVWVAGEHPPAVIHHAEHSQHACCPGVGMPAPRPEPPAPTPKDHRCCFLRAPQAPPAKSASLGTYKPAILGAADVGETPAAFEQPFTNYSADPSLRILTRLSVVLRN